MVEEKYKDCDIVAYRFPEDAPYKADDNDYALQLQPVLSRRRQPVRRRPRRRTVPRVWWMNCRRRRRQPAGSRRVDPQVRLIPAGAGGPGQGVRGQLVTQTILDQAVPPDGARKQVKAFLAVGPRPGRSGPGEVYANDFRYDLRWKTAK